MDVSALALSSDNHKRILDNNHWGSGPALFQWLSRSCEWPTMRVSSMRQGPQATHWRWLSSCLSCLVFSLPCPSWVLVKDVNNNGTFIELVAEARVRWTPVAVTSQILSSVDVVLTT